MTTNNTSTYRRPATKEARERANAYLRKYRQEHPDKVREWRESYIIRKAARLLAASDGPREGGGGE